MSKEPRYYVTSEHLRGERRSWNVRDRERKTWRGDDHYAAVFTTEKAAKRECERLNNQD